MFNTAQRTLLPAVPLVVNLVHNLNVIDGHIRSIVAKTPTKIWCVSFMNSVRLKNATGSIVWSIQLSSDVWLLDDVSRIPRSSASNTKFDLVEDAAGTNWMELLRSGKKLMIDQK